MWKEPFFLENNQPQSQQNEQFDLVDICRDQWNCHIFSSSFFFFFLFRLVPPTCKAFVFVKHWPSDPKAFAVGHRQSWGAKAGSECVRVDFCLQGWKHLNRSIDKDCLEALFWDSPKSGRFYSTVRKDCRNLLLRSVKYLGVILQLVPVCP